MIRTIFYEPVKPREFRQNMQTRWSKYSSEVASFNANNSMSQRLNDELIYHVLDTTVFVRRSSQTMMVGITANVAKIENDEIAQAKSLLEKITKVKLLEAST